MQIIRYLFLTLIITALQAKNLDFSNQTLINKNFSKQNLTGANFQNTRIFGCNFTGTILNKAQFSGAQIDITAPENSTALIAQKSLFTAAQLQDANFGPNGSIGAAMLKGTQFNFADLTGAVCNGIQAEGCSFAFSILDKADFQSVGDNHTNIVLCDFECSSQNDTQFDDNTSNYQQCVGINTVGQRICQAYVNSRPDLPHLANFCARLPQDDDSQNDVIGDATGCELKLVGTDWEHIYQAHPYYPYALTSGDKALWDKVCASCGILTGLDSWLARLWYKSAVANCRAEQAQSPSTTCPSYNSNQISQIRLAMIPTETLFQLGTFTQKGISYSYDEGEAGCLDNNTPACPSGTAIDQVCQSCVTDLTNGVVDTALYQELKTQALTQGTEVSFVGDKAQRFACINSCLSAFEKPTRAKLKRPLRCTYPKLYFCKDTACISYRW